MTKKYYIKQHSGFVSDADMFIFKLTNFEKEQLRSHGCMGYDLYSDGMEIPDWSNYKYIVVPTEDSDDVEWCTEIKSCGTKVITVAELIHILGYQQKNGEVLRFPTTEKVIRNRRMYVYQPGLIDSVSKALEKLGYNIINGTNGKFYWLDMAESSLFVMGVIPNIPNRKGAEYGCYLGRRADGLIDELPYDQVANLLVGEDEHVSVESDGMVHLVNADKDFVDVSALAGWVLDTKF